MKTKQNKTNVTPEKDVMTSANQTPGGHKFAPVVAIKSQQGRANQHEPACFGLSSPWPFPSRSGIYHCMPYSSLVFFCIDPFCHEMSRPLFCRFAPLLFFLGCSRPLVDVDAESSEVVQETDVMTTFSGVTFVLFCFVLVFMLSLKPRPFVQPLFDMQAPR